jgi:hypothetical protein
MNQTARKAAQKRTTKSVTLRRKANRKTRSHAQGRPKGRGKSSFTQRDVTRAIKAVEKLGKTVRTVSVGGVLLDVSPHAPAHASTNEWDDVLVMGEGA